MLQNEEQNEKRPALSWGINLHAFRAIHPRSLCSIVTATTWESPAANLICVTCIQAHSLLSAFYVRGGEGVGRRAVLASAANFKRRRP